MSWLLDESRLESRSHNNMASNFIENHLSLGLFASPSFFRFSKNLDRPNNGCYGHQGFLD
jgi:hypothetical protein